MPQPGVSPSFASREGSEQPPWTRSARYQAWARAAPGSWISIPGPGVVGLSGIHRRKRLWDCQAALRRTPGNLDALASMICVLPLLQAPGGIESDNRSRRPADLLHIPEEFKSGRLDFFQKRALRRERRRAFSLWEPKLQLETRVQLARGDGLMFHMNRRNFFCCWTIRGSNPVARSDGGLLRHH